MTTQGWLQRPASQWNEEALNSLVGSDEGVFLEFKKASEFLDGAQLNRDKRRSEIAETVSAYLNSSGGVLLIGVQTDNDPKVRGREILKPIVNWTVGDSLEARNTNMTASQISDLIHGNITPTPLGIQVSTVTVTIESNTGDVHVVTVPPSSLGAHQSVPTKIYYRRTDDGDYPMFDYEIRDVNNRRSGPVLKGELLLLSHSEAQLRSDEPNTSWVGRHFEIFPVDGASVQMMHFLIRADVRNLGRSIAEKFKIDSLRNLCFRGGTGQGQETPPTSLRKNG